MLTFFPASYEDELLYSVLARYHKYCGINIKATTQDLYSNSKVIAGVLFPCSLTALIGNMPSSWPYTVDDLIHKYTLYPLFKAFWNEKKGNTIYNLMQTNSVRAIHLKAGIYSSKIPPNSYLKFCPECFIKDIETYGESYWRRLHQVPGILVCHIHKSILLNSTVKVILL